MVSFLSYLLPILLASLIAIYLSQPIPSFDWDNNYLSKAQGLMTSRKGKNVKKVDPLHVFAGLNVVVTGATSGIGMELSRFLVSKGATVVITGRSESKLSDMIKGTIEGSSRLVPIVMELSDLDSVSKGANEIKRRFKYIDILVCNAGMHYAKHSQNFATTRGLDISFTVNYLSHFLLTEILIPKLSKSPMPLVLHMTSSYHWASDGLDLMSQGGNEAPNAARPGGVAKWFDRHTRAYSNSKLAQILHTRALRAVKGDWLRAVSVCPGWVATQIGGNHGSLSHLGLSLLAFPLENNGWGLASTLEALLDYSSERTTDYYINSDISDVTNTFPNFFWGKWVSDIGLRTIITDVFSMYLLVMQRLSIAARPSLSSVESHDKELAMNLYNWSKREVKDYI
jgi:NAD(P)-dependent dehydrogenase (short-subunit alcohol dehydrogenase family)